MGKRRYKEIDLEEKENRLERKMRRLMREFKKHRKSSNVYYRLEDRDSRSKKAGQRDQRHFEEEDPDYRTQSPSHSPLVSPPVLEDGCQALLTEVTSERGSPVPSEDREPGHTGTVQADVHVPAVDQLATDKEKNIQKSSEEVVIEDLEVEILEAIGKRVAEERILAPAIPKSVAVRLEDILKEGLPKEEREKLIKDHAPPKNCVLIDPPKLNEELKASLNETAVKRDGRIVDKQKKITACLALMGSCITEVINNNKSDIESQKLPPSQISLVKRLSEAARLMADLQRDESLTRRSLILATISSSQKETLESSTAEEWLFGQKLGERLKAAKAIERSGKELKAKPKITGKAKNFKGPPRRQPFRAMTSGGYRNKFYNQNQFNKKKWTNQNAGNRNDSQPQSTTQQKKA